MVNDAKATNKPLHPRPIVATAAVVILGRPLYHNSRTGGTTR